MGASSLASDNGLVEKCLTSGLTQAPSGVGEEPIVVRCCSPTHDGLGSNRVNAADRGADASGNGARKARVYAQTYGCHEGKTFAEAKGICEKHNLRLCSASELSEDDVAIGTGCGFDHRRAWTNTPCGYITKIPSAAGEADVRCSSPSVH